MSVIMNIETCSPHYVEFTHSLQVASSESDRKVRPTATAKMATLCEWGDRNAFFGHSAISVHPWRLLQGRSTKTNSLHLRNRLNCSPSRTTFRFEGYLLSHPKPSGLWVSPLRRGSSEGLPTTLTRPRDSSVLPIFGCIRRSLWVPAVGTLRRCT